MELECLSMWKGRCAAGSHVVRIIIKSLGLKGRMSRGVGVESKSGISIEELSKTYLEPVEDIFSQT